MFSTLSKTPNFMPIQKNKMNRNVTLDNLGLILSSRRDFSTLCSRRFSGLMVVDGSYVFRPEEGQAML
jgi:hypothetical protein